MHSIPNDVLVKLIVELLKYLIISAFVFGYKEWWPRLKNLAGGLWLGGRRRLARLEKLIGRYENFTHVEEMESQSEVHRNFANAFATAICIILLSMPLALAVVVLFGQAIVVDVVMNLKAGNVPPKYPDTIWAARIYGGVLGIGIAFLLHFIDRAHTAASAFQRSIGKSG